MCLFRLLEDYANSCFFIQDIYSNSKHIRKSNAYSALVHRVPNTFTLIDKKEHSWKRRVLTQGFSESAMHELEPVVLDCLNRLCESMIDKDLCTLVDKENGWSAPKDMSDWCKFELLLFL
jgi:cytochrome P450